MNNDNMGDGRENLNNRESEDVVSPWEAGTSPLTDEQAIYLESLTNPKYYVPDMPLDEVLQLADEGLMETITREEWRRRKYTFESHMKAYAKSLQREKVEPLRNELRDSGRIHVGYRMQEGEISDLQGKEKELSDAIVQRKDELGWKALFCKELRYLKREAAQTRSKRESVPTPPKEEMRRLDSRRNELREMIPIAEAEVVEETRRYRAAMLALPDYNESGVEVGFGLSGFRFIPSKRWYDFQKMDRLFCRMSRPEDIGWSAICYRVTTKGNKALMDRIHQKKQKENPCYIMR